MTTQGLLLNELTPILREKARKSGWSLCVGAGTSRSVFPAWDELARSLCGIAFECPSLQIPPDLSCYSLDALIAAAQNRLGMPDDEFATLITDSLYADIRASVAPEDFQIICDMLAARIPARNKKASARFLEIYRSKYPNTSALSLAELLRDVANAECAPASVLSFNAEPLLPALVHALVYEHFAARSAAPEAGELSTLFDLVTHSITNVKHGRIPYVFCHGLLPVPDPSGTRHRRGSVDKLVFSETSYLLLANSAFSWQSSTFLQTAASRSIVFVGVSLSDANMRRWLSWVQRNRLLELKQIYGAEGDSIPHYWINRLPSDPVEKALLESVMHHLGVRLVWIESWEHLGLALRRMLGI